MCNLLCGSGQCPPPRDPPTSAFCVLGLQVLYLLGALARWGAAFVLVRSFLSLLNPHPLADIVTNKWEQLKICLIAISEWQLEQIAAVNLASGTE